MVRDKSMRELLEKYVIRLIQHDNKLAKGDKDRKILNEYCVQFYLALFLGKNGYEIRLEENTGRRNEKDKRELDLRIRNNDGSSYVIEIKCPLSGQSLEVMKKVFEDIKYLENLRKNDKTVTNGYFIMVTYDKNFWLPYNNNNDCKNNKWLYDCFRKNDGLVRIVKELGVSKCYDGQWLPGDIQPDKFRYFIIEV